MHFLYLIRHSIIDPASPRMELSADGVALAQRFGAWLAASGYPHPSALYASDRPRATQTAAHVAFGLGTGISTVTDLREDKRYDLLVPDACTLPGGLPLTVMSALTENNPPESVVATPEYAQLTAEHRRPGILLDWEGKRKRVDAYLATLLDILEREPSALVTSHGNIIQQALQALLPDTLNLSAFDGPTPHVGLTVLVKEGDTAKLNRLFSTL